MGVNPGELTFGAGIAAAGTPQMVVTQTGNVGIGTTAPTSVLDLSNAITTIKLAVYEDGTPNNTYGIGVNSGKLSFGAAIPVTGTPQMVLTSNGYLGIGTTSPSYPLYVNGTAFATGAAGALSDRRYKKAIKPLAPGALSIVEKLRPVTFHWKKPTDAGMQGEQIGFIAQEVQKTLPAIVMTQGDAKKTLGIKYDALIPILTAAIQEEQARIRILESEVATLEAQKAEIKQLQAQFAELRAPR